VERAFDGSTDGVWLSTSITIITVVLGVPVSRAADLWGRRWFLIGLTFCGVIGSIIIARATSMNVAIAGEVISGLAFGAQALLHAVMAEVLPRKWRPFAQAIATVSGSLGGVVGLLVGGALTRYGNYEGFRNLWYMATAMYALSTILCFFLYNPPVRRSQLGLTNSEKLQQLDWVGYIFLTLGLVTLCMGLSWSENPYGWRDAHVLAPFVTGLALLASLIVYETKVKKDGMCHHKLFSIHKWNFSIALWCIFVDGISFFATNSYFTMEVGILYESDPLKATVRYALGFISTCVMAGLAGMYCARTKTIRAPAVFAFGVMTVFFICMATATKGSSAAVWAYAIIFGIALGGTLCSIVALSQLSTPKDLLTIATGLIISVRSFGGSIGLPLCEYMLQGFV
jgi:MFS family permease